MGCVFHLLYEVDHAGLSVSHLPVKGQGLQAVITGKRAPCAEVHGAAGLGVAGHRFPPVCPLFVLWRVRKKGWFKRGKKEGEEQSGKIGRLACRNTSALMFSYLLQRSGGRADVIHLICI